MHFSLSQSASTNQVWWPFVYLSPRTAKEPSTVYAGVILFLALLLFCYFISIKPLCSPYWPTQYDLKHLNKIVLISYSATRTSQSTEQCVIWIKVNPIVHFGHIIHSRRSLRCVKWRNKVNFLTLVSSGKSNPFQFKQIQPSPQNFAMQKSVVMAGSEIKQSTNNYKSNWRCHPLVLRCLVKDVTQNTWNFPKDVS